jgi:hypothetical protein
MYRILTAFFLLVASVATSWAQPALFLATDPAGNFRGVFINYGPPCPGAVFDAAGAIRGPLIGFQTWKAWSLDCRATTVWRGRMINPTTVVVKWVMTYGGRSVRGVDTFRRI